jgi:pullulanase
MISRIVLPLCRQIFVCSLLLGAALPVFAQVPAGDVRIHYFRPDGNYAGWGLYAWNVATTTYSWCASQVAQTGTDSFGVYFDVPVTPTAGSPAGQLGFILNNCANGQIKDPGPNQYLQVTEYSQGWVVSGNPTVFYNPPVMGTNPVPAGDARIHYYRSDGNYTGWGLYGWNATTATYSWCSSQVPITGIDSFGVYYDVPVTPTAGTPSGQLGFILNNCDNGQIKDPGANQYLQVTEYTQGWVITGNVTVFYSQPATGTNPIPAGDARIHYNRPDGNYTGWGLYAWNATTATYAWCSSQVPITGVDSFGVYYDVPVTPTAGTPAGQLGFILNNCDAGQIKDPGPNQYLQITQFTEAWVLSGNTTVYTTQPAVPPPAGIARIHYFRPDGNYSGWGLYAWNATVASYSWCSSQVAQSGTDSYGVYFDIPINPAAGTPVGQLGFIINNCPAGGIKDPGPNQYLQVTQYTEAWVISGDVTVFTTEPTVSQIAGAGLYQHQAFWVDRTTVAMPASGYQSTSTYSLLYSLNAGLNISSTGTLAGGTGTLALVAASGLSPAEAATYPQLAGYSVLHLASSVPVAAMAQALTGQLVVEGVNANGALTYVSGVQDAGVLDDLFYYPGKLGPVFNHGQLTFNLWAPTAQSIKLLLYTGENDTTPAQTLPMTETNGVWSVAGQSSWKGQYYLYDVVVYVPSQQQIVENIVSDPYSSDIALNGAKTRITDLTDEATKPQGWDRSSSPWLDSLNDFSVYELHVREFSVADTSVPTQYQGTYLAFTNPSSYGMTHLRYLAQSGLKAAHIMPSFHIASVDENKANWQSPGDLTVYPPDGTQQQAAVEAVQQTDGYNFGYDPVHFFAPNGAFAFNPDNRVMEYRQMVMALHNAGLRVVQDVVFNHTAQIGENTFSILDEVVPGYYYRLDASGNVETASCCYDTAAEHRMFAKLMVDNVVQNAIQYKIDGYRFDDMSLHFVSNMQAIKQALRSLTLEKDGVDGSKIYIYGEGFLNSETAALGVNATQANLYGYGIGTFNDRIRDGIRGGNSFDQTIEQVQGFATGLFTDPSYYTSTTLGESLATQQATVNSDADLIRLGLAGNLRDFQFVNSAGTTVTGSQITYGGQPAGYAATPLEAVNYCSVHDNQTLFDAIQLKSAIPGTTATGGDSITTRTRRQVLSMSIIALGQGVPFFFGGDDLLRSKDMDDNSYNSGDWFSRVNWTLAEEEHNPSLLSQESNNWGIGLPVQNVNGGQWPIMQPLLANPALTPTPQNISAAAEAFKMFLRIRGSSDLFHMATLAEVQNNLHFFNTGTTQIPGLIVMKLDANGHDYGAYSHIVVVFNATLNPISFQNDQLRGLHLRLHPEEASSMDAATASSSANDKTGTVQVPGLTTAVFVSGND